MCGRTDQGKTFKGVTCNSFLFFFSPNINIINLLSIYWFYLAHLELFKVTGHLKNHSKSSKEQAWQHMRTPSSGSSCCVSRALLREVLWRMGEEVQGEENEVNLSSQKAFCPGKNPSQRSSRALTEKQKLQSQKQKSILFLSQLCWVSSCRLDGMSFI